jgi:hypothetical protein
MRLLSPAAAPALLFHLLPKLAPASAVSLRALINAIASKSREPNLHCFAAKK